jgi:hypothetical protein
MNRRTVALLGWASALAGCGAATGEPITLGGGPTSTLSDGLIGYWKLDEATADVPVLDASGHGHDGTAVNGPAPSPLVAPLKIRNSASRVFNGVDQYVDLGNPAELGFTGAITLAAWVNITALADNCQTVISHGYRINPDGEVALRGGAGICGQKDAPPSWAVGAWDGADHFAQAAVLPDEFGTWTHLVGTYDGQAWRLYRNGAEIARHSDAVGPFAIDASWSIGGRAPSDPPTELRLLDGRIDDVRIYNRALSPAEVLDLYNL